MVLKEVAIQPLSKISGIEAPCVDYAKLFKAILSFSLKSSVDIEVTVVSPLMVVRLLNGYSHQARRLAKTRVSSVCGIVHASYQWFVSQCLLERETLITLQVFA